MRKILILITGILIATIVDARSQRGGGHVSVNGYTRSNGTYVQPHYRTSPDGIKSNNWSYVGNVNPYTGKIGNNTNNGSKYQGGHTTGGGYITSNTNSIALGSHYITVGQHEIHNTKTAADYLD